MTDTADRAATGARGRTRRAILSAAATVLGQDRNAPLSAVARAADVGRSTLHRYFPDRDELVAATYEDSLAEIGRAMEEARLREGPALEAVRRMIAAHIEVGDRVVFAFGDPALAQAHDTGDEPDEPEEIVALFTRGQEEGALDTGVEPEWFVHVMWALVFTGLDLVHTGRISRHDLVPRILRTFERGALVR